jgi:hypothetical protein
MPEKNLYEAQIMFLSNYFKRKITTDYPLLEIKTEIPEVNESSLYEEKIQAQGVNFFEHLPNNILHNHIYLYLKTSDVINIIGNSQLQAKIGEFIGKHDYEICERTAQSRQLYSQHHNKRKSQKNKLYLFGMFLLTCSTGLNAYFTSQIFMKNKDTLMQFADEYKIPRDDADFIPYKRSHRMPDYGVNQSCEERLNYLTSYDIIFSWEPKDCITTDLYTNNWFKSCSTENDYLYEHQTAFGKNLSTPGGEECHRIFVDLQKQKGAPILTAPPYLMSASFVFASIVAAYYYYQFKKDTSRFPQVWNDLVMFDRNILDDVGRLLNEYHVAPIVGASEINKTLREYNAHRYGLFQAPNNKTYIKPADAEMEKQRQIEMRVGL